MADDSFTQDELTRYSRHVLLPEVGLAGQKKLKAASVLVVGSGGLGSPVSLYLASAGVGTIGLLDFDTVDLSNLQRQILFKIADIGKSKAKVGAQRLKALNDCIKVKVHDVHMASDNALKILADYDVVVDGTDNFASRYLLNDACQRLGKPYVYGSIYRFEGQASVFIPGKGCYRCLFPVMPDVQAVPNCAEIGVMGAVAGIIGTIQATETIKLLTGAGDSLSGRLLIFDALGMTFDALPIERDAMCTACGDGAEVEIVDEQFACAGQSDQDSEGRPIELHWVAQEKPRDISPEDLSKMLDEDGKNLLLLDVRTPEEFTICALSGAQLIPLIQLPRRLEEIDKEKHIVVYCHHGVRSRSACQLLRESGFEQVSNLRGGIAAWAREVDTSLPQY